MNLQDITIKKVSVVIRTLNEARHLADLFSGIRSQECPGIEIETVLVDSGSTDGTLDIANSYGARIVHIKKEEFSFGRSLNLGCATATGDALVIVSGHCIPTGKHWIRDLVAPLGKLDMAYVYGRQMGDDTSHFSERRIFSKYFPADDHLPQDGFYCNNANSVLLKSVWEKFKFDEELTGLEDMHLAKRLLAEGYRIGYVASAGVYHLHSETWAQIGRRFEREAIALQYIMPEVHLSSIDVVRYFLRAVVRDLLQAQAQKTLLTNLRDIVTYRYLQFLGSYRGNHIHRQLSRANKEQYFYPNRKAQAQASAAQQLKEQK